jgi:hypothetical protein
MTPAPGCTWDVLARDESVALLNHARLGRLTVTAKALPCVVPVIVEANGEDVVLWSPLGARVEVSSDQVVALEVGDLGDGEPGAWSVVVLGMLEDDGTPDSTAGRATIGAIGARRFYLRAQLVTGWRLGRTVPVAPQARSEGTPPGLAAPASSLP